MGLWISATMSGNRMIETNQTNISETKQIIETTYFLKLPLTNLCMIDEMYTLAKIVTLCKISKT